MAPVRTLSVRLALRGGEPVSRRVRPSWPSFDETDVVAATAVLKSGRVNYWTGSEGSSFEREYADFSGCQHAVAVANGTVALELALRALGIGPGDEVIVPPRSFIATASAVVMVGAVPRFADVEHDGGNLTAESVRAALTPKTRAIIVVHLGGWPAEMDSITELASNRGIGVVEDCAQAHGAEYRGRRVGSLGDIAAFSFCQDKIMTTAGEGGMVTTNREDLWKAAWGFKDHGKAYDTVFKREHPPGFRWLHESFGTNWRMTEIQSAVGRVALARVDGWLERRRRFACILDRGLANTPGLRVPVPPAHVVAAYYRYYAYVQPGELAEGWNRDRVMAAVNAEGVPCYSGSCSEMYHERAFTDAGLAPAEPLRAARELGETSLMFLVHPTLEDQDIDDTINAVNKVMAQACSTSFDDVPV